MFFVSYFTHNNYEPYAKKLIESLKKFNLAFEIEKKEDKFPNDPDKSWRYGTNLKPAFILQKLIKFRCPICWLDIDTEIIEYPEYLVGKIIAPGITRSVFRESYDIAVYNWYDDDNKITNSNPEKLDCGEMLSSSGVFAFNYTSKAIELLIRWSSEVTKNPIIADDQLFDKVWNSVPELGAMLMSLPKEYNRMDRHWPHIKPVINHYWLDGAIRKENNNDKENNNPYADIIGSIKH